MEKYSTFIAKNKSYCDHFLRLAPSFYRTFPHDHKIDIKLPVHVLKENSYLELLKQLNRCPNNNILIVSHASNDGLYLSINSQIAKKWCAMAAILLYTKLYNKHESLLGEDDPSKWSSTIVNEATKKTNLHSAIKALQTLSDNKNTKGKKKFDKLVMAHFKNELDRIKKKQAAKKLIQMADSQVKEKLRELLKISGIKRNKIKDYVTEINKTYQRKRNIEIRGCNIGKSQDVLKIMCLFFNAQRIRAPKVKIFFGSVPVRIEKDQTKLNSLMTRNVNRYIHRVKRKWIGGTTTNINRRNKDRQALYFHPRNIHQPHKDELLFLRSGKKQGQILAEDISIVKRFVIEKFGNLAPNKDITEHKTRSIILQMTHTVPFVFPQDRKFGSYLVQVQNPENFKLK